MTPAVGCPTVYVIGGAASLASITASVSTSVCRTQHVVRDSSVGAVALRVRDHLDVDLEEHIAGGATRRGRSPACDCGHPLIIVTSTSAWQARWSDVLVCGPVQLSGHLEQSEVLIDSVAVVVRVHDDLGDVHPRHR